MSIATIGRRIPFVGTLFGGNRKAGRTPSKRIANENAAWKTLQNRSKNVGFIPASILFISLIYYVKDLLSELYAHTLANSHKKDKNRNNYADLKTIDRQYLVRTGLIDAPAFGISLLAFLKYNALISTVMIGGTFIIRNWLANLILNEKKEVFLKFNDDSQQEVDNNKEPSNNDYNNNPPNDSSSNNNSPPPSDNTNNKPPGNNNGNTSPSNNGNIPPGNNDYAPPPQRGYQPTSGGLTNASNGGGYTQGPPSAVPIITITNSPYFGPITRTG